MDDVVKIPIIKLYDDLIVSIQVDLSDRVVLQLKEDITNAIVRTGATGLVIDVSGIDLMDSFITRAISDIGKIARLMGVETALAGLNPMISMTLVEMGMEFEGVHPALNLESALELLADAKTHRGLLGEDVECLPEARQEGGPVSSAGTTFSGLMSVPTALNKRG